MERSILLKTIQQHKKNTQSLTMPCVCAPETHRTVNVSHWDYIPFSKWESYDYDAIPMGLFESATLWLKLDTHAQFDP